MGKRRNSNDKIEGKEEEEDPWRLIDPPDEGKPWAEKGIFEKIKTVVIVLFRIVLVLGFLYLFVCSLSFLTDAFRLLGGKQAGEAFTNNEILTNPIADLAIGVLATVLLQSSSTSTSIVVAMVAADILPVRPAIFIVMGANIGTSVTNTIVALGQSMDRNEFRKAFAGATVHDMFNWLSVIIILPIEWVSGAIATEGSWKDCGVLCVMTEKITNGLARNESEEEPELLKVITKPFTELVIQVDKGQVTDIATGDLKPKDAKLVKEHCDFRRHRYEPMQNNDTGEWSCMRTSDLRTEEDKCEFMFWKPRYQLGWSDEAVGVCVLIFALLILIACLVFIVKLLHALLKGQIAKAIRKFLNSNIPTPIGRFITGYVAIFMGAGLTILVQSSSIFTSALTPLVGVGVLHIKRMYPLTLGANIGTTVTAILAAFAADAEKLDITLQVALSHLFFNIFGILIWYPIPFMRKVPIKLAKILGNTTADYRWFAVFYLIAMFFIMPASVFGLSLAGWRVLLGVLLPLLILFIIVAVINVMQAKCPDRLCSPLRDWEWLPEPLHSLEPYDRLIVKMRNCCCPRDDEEDRDDVEELRNGYVNKKTDDAEDGLANGGYMDDQF